MLVRPISAAKKEAVIEITGEEQQGMGDTEQAIMTTQLTFGDATLKGQVVFFILYRMHSGEDVPGRGNHIWKPVYKSEIKSSNNNRSVAQFDFN